MQMTPQRTTDRRGAASPVRFETPRSLDEAVAHLADSDDVTLWAGGTDLMVAVNRGALQPTVGVSLRRLPELRSVTSRRIGSAVTFQALEQLVELPALAEAARSVGSRQIRAMGTIGGNVGTASPAGDAIPVLVAYGADILLTSRAGGRTMSVEDFVVGPRAHSLRKDELIEAMVLPERLPVRQAFGKVGIRNAMTISLVSACVTRDVDGATRVALGAVGPKVIRARAAEEMIGNERRPSGAALDEFARMISMEVRPISDHRATETYRRHAAGVLAKRQLMRCLA